MNKIYENLLEEISDLHEIPQGAFNIRADGEGLDRRSTENIEIKTKTDKPGIDIIVKENTQKESVHIPVVISKAGVKDLVYNDFYIGDNSDIVIVAGCGIHNSGDETSQHDGIHRFFIGKNARIKYVEKHYGEGSGKGEKILNPVTEVYMEENSYMEMDSVQIQGVSSTIRETKGELKDGATLIVNEKIMTTESQVAKTIFDVKLNGENSSTHVVSRSVAKDNSVQTFISKVDGNNKCAGHTECDSIIVGNGKVSALPEVFANHPDASLVHEAAIGKIAGEQLMKLMTLGLTEEEAEEKIISGFIR